MATPNLANINTYFTRTKVVNVSTTLSNVITNLPFSNSLIKVNSLIVSNESAATTTNVNVMLVSNGIETNLATKLLMPPGNVITLFNKTNEFNILENSALRANAENNSVIEMVVTYEEMGEKTKNNYIAEAYPIQYLVVAGGGAGGAIGPFGVGGGGGGAGGLLYATSTSFYNGTYSVIVGAGGAATVCANGNPGVNSSITTSIANFSNIIAVGGGGGGISFTDLAGGGQLGRGSNGGSGGGSGYSNNAPPACCVSGALGVPGQGNPGGYSCNSLGSSNGSGGGGAVETGGNTGPGGVTGGGKGGNGCLIGISGVLSYYAGGGGGGVHVNYAGCGIGQGGCGGGGAGGCASSGTNGATNTGGGGGGLGQPNPGPTGYAGSSGGSGIVIIRYPTEAPKILIGSTTGNVTITSNAGYCIYQFTSSGSFTIQ